MIRRWSASLANQSRGSRKARSPASITSTGALLLHGTACRRKYAAESVPESSCAGAPCDSPRGKVVLLRVMTTLPGSCSSDCTKYHV